MRQYQDDEAPTLVELREAPAWPRYVLVGALVALAAASLVGHWLVIRQARRTGADCQRVAGRECPTCPGCPPCPPPQVFVDRKPVPTSGRVLCQRDGRNCFTEPPPLKPEDF